MSTEVITITIPDERPTSWNTFYAGAHWSKRKKEADRVHQMVRYALPSSVVDSGPLSERVDITVRAYFKNRPQDASNICAKLYEDALIGWVIVDDKPEYVRSMRTISEVDKKNPRVEIEVVPCA